MRNLPVFAWLDKGIYGHPIVPGVTMGIKIGRYLPPQTVNDGFEGPAEDLAAFVRSYVPGLADAAVVPVTDVDQCAYDITPDEGFVIGRIPSTPQICIAAGFCGTGYKFAPVVGELLCDFAQGKPFGYDISALDPARFGEK